jgi:hypothetical protein
MMRRIKGLLALAPAVSLGACLDLEVTNPNLPDRKRALSDPANVESILALSTWLRWYSPLHSLANVANVFPMIAGEAGNTSMNMSVYWGHELASQVWMPRHGYDAWSQCVSNANDGLSQVNEGMVLKTLDPGGTTAVDNTDRAWSWGKMWQGICIGYLALQLDRFPLATEDEPLPETWEELAAWERSELGEPNWEHHLADAIEAIEEAIKRMETGAQWVTPSTWVNGQSYTNQQIIQLAHTMIARLMIYSARTPADRQSKVDWNKVLLHTERGLTYDWGPTLLDGTITDPSYLARLNNTGSGSFRVHYLTIGPADQSGGYQNWIKVSPRTNAQRFLITTPDRRITGTTPTSNGSYVRYLTATGGFNSDLGYQNWSWYGWHRRINYQNGATHLTGHFALASADENRLFKAEALLRLNRVAEAVPLINVTRTRAQRVGTTTFATNLPPLDPVTGAVPLVSGACVPRRADGTCGNVWDALMYERDIELMGQEPTRAWMDRRGFGQLREGVWTQLPVPARYLSSLGLPVYTFGGVGGEFSAKCTAPITCVVN